MRRIIAAAFLGLAVFAMARVGAAPPLKAYGNLPGLAMASLSPSGERYALVGVLGEERRIVILGPGNELLLTVPLGTEKVRSIQWAGEDMLVVSTSSYMLLGMDFTKSHAELPHVTIISISERKTRDVFDGRTIANAVMSYDGIVQIDARWYGFFGGHTLEKGSDPSNSYWANRGYDLYRVDLATGEERRVAEGAPEGSFRDWSIGADGSILARLDYKRRDGSWALKGPEGNTLASGVSPLGDTWLVGPGRTPGTIVYSTREESGADHWYEMPVEGGAATEILADEATDGDPHFDRKTRLMSGYVRDGDQPVDVFFDPARDKRVAAARKAFPGLNVSLESASDDFNKLIVRTNGSNDSGTWWLVDIKTGKATDIGYAYPEVRPADVGAISTLSYKAADGTDLFGILTLSPGSDGRNLPLVVLPHGGPAARDYPHFDWWGQAFASRGYAVFQPNYRGSTGYGVRLRQAGHQQWGRAMQTDISDGLAELVRRGVADPKRVCIVGASYGGYAAFAGVADVHAMVREDRRESGYSAAVDRSWKWYLGTLANLDEISPEGHAAQADAPILLIHGKDDDVVPFAQSVGMRQALETAGKSVKLVELKGEDHWLSLGETRQTMLEEAVAFVQANNPADRPADRP